MLRAILVFNVPGFALGGVAVDHSGPPSIDTPLWVKDGAGRYRKQDGAMKFIHGYVVAATGTERNGWMAHDALTVSDGCP